ncbi:hypothetical protein D3C71_2223990 [compost metagenome]
MLLMIPPPFYLTEMRTVTVLPPNTALIDVLPLPLTEILPSATVATADLDDVHTAWDVTFADLPFS